jgi:hypothetical protein
MLTLLVRIYLGVLVGAAITGIYIAIRKTERPVTVEDVLWSIAAIVLWPIVVFLGLALGIKEGTSHLFRYLFRHVHLDTELYRSKKCIAKIMKERMTDEDPRCFKYPR